MLIWNTIQISNCWCCCWYEHVTVSLVLHDSPLSLVPYTPACCVSRNLERLTGILDSGLVITDAYFWPCYIWRKKKLDCVKNLSSCAFNIQYSNLQFVTDNTDRLHIQYNFFQLTLFSHSYCHYSNWYYRQNSKLSYLHNTKFSSSQYSIENYSKISTKQFGTTQMLK